MGLPRVEEVCLGKSSHVCFNISDVVVVPLKMKSVGIICDEKPDGFGYLVLVSTFLCTVQKYLCIC